ncbi:mitochondrial amidoxime-reducing component 1-like [Tubulanus polymorphus]|uniref:mitochondrial amidoxime-reducing component 1-like n=1 Tax=Tubulanus polymorphus TaxID=672921 RepID=UPI003DA2BD45
MSDLQKPGYIFASMVAASSAKLLMMVWAQKNAEKPLREVGVVDSLYVHPMKSCKAMTVTEATITPLGLAFKDIVNRKFFLINNKNEFVNLKAEATMTLIVPTLEGDNMHLNAPEMETLVIPQIFDSGPTVKCVLHGQSVEAIDCGDKAAAWCSKFLNKDGIRLVTGVAFKHPYLYKEPAYASKFPYMLLSAASLDDINSKMSTQPISMRNFRPNIVVKGPPAYDEDDWEEIVIGEANFCKRALCTRCVITLIDPETGIKDSQNEPMKTLKKHRLRAGESKPCMGLYMGPLSPGKTIHVGDKVYARKA